MSDLTASDNIIKVLQNAAVICFADEIIIIKLS